MAIAGIPNTRVSDQFVRQQLLGQVQSTQVDLLRLETQLSTGRKFQLPSEDPVAALRAVGLQRLLERNQQVQANVTTNQSYLTDTDSALSQVSSLINQVRGDVLSVTGTTATDTQRRAAAQQVQQVLRQLIDIGNQQFGGRYLFAGSETAVRPFQALDGNVVSYQGNENRLTSYGGADLLFDTNLQGNEVFGAISDAVRGTADLRPVLTFDTPLASLRDGQGVSLGSIAISDGTSTRVVDLSQAETIGDVARLIRRNSPAGNTVDVEIGARGLILQAASGNLTISEVGGTTATELGILIEAGGTKVVGADLNPTLRPTTRLADILGARARAVLRPGGGDNDIVIEADHNGEDLNGVTVSVVDNGSVQAGQESAVYDSGAKTLTIYVDSDQTTARQVVEAVNIAHEQDKTAMPFTAALDPLDDQLGGEGVISIGVTPPVLTHDGSGAGFDQTHGLQLVNGPSSATIDLSKAVTIEDLVNTLNKSGVGVLAAINQAATGIDVRTRLSGADFTIGENGGSTATQLGIRTFDTSTALESLNFGHGVSEFEGPGNTARAEIHSTGAKNDFVVEARQAGPDWDGFTVNVQDASGAGQESVRYDPTLRTIDVYVFPGVTTADKVVRLLSSDAAFSADFSARLDPRDGNPSDGTGTVSFGSATTSGGTEGGTDLTVTRNDGVTFEIDIRGAETIGDVLDLINNNSVNQDPARGVPLVARPAAFGNGIELVDNSVGTGRLTVTRINGSAAAVDLGLVAAGQGSRSSSTSGDQPDLLTGADVNRQETEGMFTALLRLAHGLTANDSPEIERAMAMLDQVTTDMNFSRAALGARQQGLDAIQTRLDNERVQLEDNLSQSYDVDIAQVISDLTGKQVVMQASLQTIAKTMQMTLLDYL
jgi:flagellin-like hook-associated protein FlgL